MGYSYGYSASLRMALACDKCGAVGGVRRRQCPHMVRGSTERSSSGTRVAMHYCSAPALCAGCFREEGGTRGLHRTCADGARQSEEEYDRRQARLQAGDHYVLARWGSWQETVPTGMVGCMFGGPGWTDHRYVLVPAAMEKVDWLEDLPPEAVEAWADPQPAAA
jgi:hypothetical protein